MHLHPFASPPPCRGQPEYIVEFCVHSIARLLKIYSTGAGICESKEYPIVYNVPAGTQYLQAGICLMINDSKPLDYYVIK